MVDLKVRCLITCRRVGKEWLGGKVYDINEHTARQLLRAHEQRGQRRVPCFEIEGRLAAPMEGVLTETGTGALAPPADEVDEQGWSKEEKSRDEAGDDEVGDAEEEESEVPAGSEDAQTDKKGDPEPEGDESEGQSEEKIEKALAPLEFLDANADEVIARIPEIHSPAVVLTLHGYEREGKNRVTVLDALEERKGELLIDNPSEGTARGPRPEEDEGGDEEGGAAGGDSNEVDGSWPRHVGGHWFELSNGKKVQGKSKADKAQAKLESAG